MGAQSGDWKTLGPIVAPLLLMAACGMSAPGDEIPRTSPIPITTGALAGAYADMVRSAILDGLGVQSFRDACPQPNWVCAIDKITSHQAGSAFVTLRSDWVDVLPESAWTGPPAGVGCKKWGDQIARNVGRFADAAGVSPTPRVTVYQSDGSRC